MNIIQKIWIKAVKLCGWKLILPAEGTRPEVDRCVFVVAPHTSALDFVFGAAFLWSVAKNGKVIIKKEFFFWPLGPILRSVGCISIDRGNRKNKMVDNAAKAFEEHEFLSVTLTPEATRKPTKNWKRGFWEIAKKANVPIVPAYWDFSKKEIGIFDTIYPTDYATDLKKVQNLYTKQMAKHPEKYIEMRTNQ
jgi:1-acyl-sn-glycerol-3-phosphate acyltransferase